MTLWPYFQDQSCSGWYKSCHDEGAQIQHSVYLNVSLALGLLIICKIFVCLEPAVVAQISGRYHQAVSLLCEAKSEL